jgi:hypothetical protein
MPADRNPFARNARKYFELLEGWSPDPGGFVNVVRDALAPGEAERKSRRFPAIVARAAQGARVRIASGLDDDALRARATGKMSAASFYYLFTGDRKALKWAAEALDALAAVRRPHFCYITLVGSVDIDLQTAGVTRALAAMRTCFAGALDPAVARRLDRMAVERCLGPALEALRTRKYWWTECRHNWRSVMAGSFAMGAMAFADVFGDWRELVEYGLEGVLVVLEDGDRAGGWSEGPGYWEYGIGHCAEFAAELKRFTGGRVDLFRHRYLRRAGDFPVYMTAAPGRFWNWSDCGKTAGSSLTLCILAREYGNRAYQAAALRRGVGSIRHLFYLDLDLKKEAPSAASGFGTTRIFPDTGVAVMRTGFGPDDAFVGVKAGVIGPAVNHEHADLGSIVIHAGGRELLAELEGWPYAQYTGRAGGFFDKRGRRWDYDGNDIVGHNLVVLEGRYPPFSAAARARLDRVDLGDGCELIAVDATRMHRALARGVRRYAIYMRPDLLLLVDEVRARKPVRARCLFHYLERAEVGPEGFTIAGGRARLHGVSLHPSAEHNVIVGREERRITYHTERGRMERTNDCVYTANLHRSANLVFVTGLHFGKGPLPRVRWTLEGDPHAGPFEVAVRGRGIGRRLRFDLAAGRPEEKVGILPG